MTRFLLPLAFFLGLLGFLAAGLGRDPRELPSPLIGKPAPEFRLPQLHDAARVVTPAEFKGRAWMLNVWASWCAACRDEHPALLELSRRGLVPIVGLNYKDGREEGRAWLQRMGDPYVLSAYDADGRAGVDYGVYGVPETFIIDARGVIRLRHVGPITPQVMQDKLLPLLGELNGS